jgi:DNA-binding transcriptional LysR family regulator
MEDRLKKFASLYEAGSFTKAARELHISQPALSAAIAKLERELKSQLLVRGARPLKLSPAGEIVYQAAKDLSVQSDNLKLRLSELAGRPLHLKIGMIDSVADALFASGDGLQVLDDAKVSVVVNNSRYLLEATLRGELDVAFVARQPKATSNLVFAESVAEEPLVVVTEEQAPKSFIGYDQPSNTFSLVDQALRNHGIEPQYNFYSTSPGVILRLALLGKGVAVLPYLAVREHLKSGKLIRLKPRLIPRPIVVISRRDRKLPPVTGQVSKQVALVINELMLDAKC